MKLEVRIAKELWERISDVLISSGLVICCVLSKRVFDIDGVARVK